MSDELCLRLLRQSETGAPTILALAANGVLAASEEGVSVLGAPLSETEWDILRQAQLVFEKNVTTLPARWQARCHGQALVCAINDTRLKWGESSSIKPGDRIEIGLLRLRIVNAEETASLSSQSPQPLQQGDASDNAQAPAESFDLGRLADAPAWDAAGKENKLFDIIGVHDPEFDDARRDSPDSSGTPASAPEEDILVRLADEYARVILNPEQLHRQPWGETTPAPEDLAVLPPSVLPHEREWEKWEKDQSLEDFISGKLSIQDVLDRLGIDDSQQLPTPQVADEVLALFAQGLERKRTERLPVRTRRDHHRISLDSHYQPERSSGSWSDVQKPDTDDS